MSYKINVMCNGWTLISNFVYHKPVELYVDFVPSTPKPENTVRIIMIQESHNVQHIINFVQSRKDMYDYVFTYLDEILKTNEKAVEFICINTWIKNTPSSFKENKKLGVSTLVGGKGFMEGHRMRHQLWYRQNQLTVPKDFWLSSHYKFDVNYSNQLVLGDSKDPMFNNMFHIAIENRSLNNMFTEKLIDCFQTFTIPIYWGAPNIGNYFNTDGMLIGNDVTELIAHANNISEELYESKKAAIEDNFYESMKYTKHTNMLDGKLNEILNEDGRG